MTKKNSSFLYGIAVLMMLFHHLFSVPERLGGGTTSDLLIRLAWSAKLCVALFAFISGYGMFRGSKAPEESIRSYYLKTAERGIRFAKKYWIVFLLAYPIGCLSGKIDLLSPNSFINCFVGLGNYINREWWYVRQYLLFLIWFPLFEVIYCFIKKRKYRNLAIVCGVVVTVCACYAFYFSHLGAVNILRRLIGTPIYWMIFILGGICAISPIKEYFEKFRSKNTAIALLMLCLLIGFRVFLAESPDYNDIDPILILPLVGCLLVIEDKMAIIEKVVSYIGKYSMYMWLTHTFFCYYYLNDFFVSLKYPVVQYTILLVCSLLTSIMLQKIENSIDKLILQIRQH